ncbi:hypothetical protein [Bacillus sp. B15-48]|uniref:hypothetical protein n=1 Tax=Bacillus sp. B15-48 TaxID=1548601 RepID=UPI00193F7BD3|nr:hypothetical protein [Bacillus sp. B15-48]MBM4761197.1 hypothetical protein [Bacillus sp. B15-48]
MIKFILYLAVFYFIGYNYGKMTNGTIFDNFWVMLLSLFVIIFLFEWLISLFKKKRNANEVDVEKQDYETWDEAMESVKKDFEKTWNIKYENNDIKIINTYNHEELYINDQLVSEKKRNHWYSWLIPYQTLTGTVEERRVKVKLGGVFSLNCKVYVDQDLIFKEKIKYNLFTGEK